MDLTGGTFPEDETALEAQLLIIDKDKSLEIFKFLGSVNSDPIVKDYVDKLLDIKFIPSVPLQDEFEELHLKTTDCALSEVCSSTLVSLQMLFCQSRYFSNNIGQAIKHRKSVINTQANLHMPGFSRLPADILNKMTALKQSFAIQLQAISYDGSQFFQEHLLIEGAHLIYCEVKDKIDQSKLTREITNHFDIHFVKAQTEFLKVFNIKDIDWKTYENRVKHSSPFWRKRNQEPPKAKSFFATKIVQRILNKQESFDPSTVQYEFKDFMEKGEFCSTRMKNDHNKRWSSHRYPQQHNHRKNGSNSNRFYSNTNTSGERNKKFKRDNKQYNNYYKRNVNNVDNSEQNQYPKSDSILPPPSAAFQFPLIGATHPPPPAFTTSQQQTPPGSAPQQPPPPTSYQPQPPPSSSTHLPGPSGSKSCIPSTNKTRQHSTNRQQLLNIIT
ncbi:unnamed protein product [Orchesella dallaii]|uniref:Uncharacterized protein n=1 Tax=Orchesella dallaii TaxID=48710 RepID=A0ABP1RH86_9HEXA